MSVQIEAIRFNHDLNSPTHDAFNIRKNATQQVPNPEWRHRRCINPEDSLAAYAIEETRGNTLTIQVVFRLIVPARAMPIGVPRQETVEIRAVDPFLWYLRRTEELPLTLREIIESIRRGVDPHLPTNSLNVLGEVKAREVTFYPREDLRGRATFELENGIIWERGVGAHDIAWLWQYRLSPSDRWSDITLSKHRIYTVLEIPKSPWVQTPHNDPSVPWIEALNYACSWARGAKNLDEAAGLVTRRIYDLGPEVMEYDVLGGGSPAYSFLWLNDTPAPYLFDCTAFLELLNGGIGWGSYVNCSDCATFVSTFANILGCELSQSKMFGVDAPIPFEVNPILLIGSDVWQPPRSGAFYFHEVAWKGLCTSDDNIFDACLAVDGDSDPSAPPHEFLLPVNMPFGEYRDRLARNGADCVAHSHYCQRRNIV